MSVKKQHVSFKIFSDDFIIGFSGVDGFEIGVTRGSGPASLVNVSLFLQEQHTQSQRLELMEELYQISPKNFLKKITEYQIKLQH